MWESISQKLSKLYTSEEVKELIDALQNLSSNNNPAEKYRLSSKDIALITYANSTISPGESSIRVLDSFTRRIKLDDSLNTIHILPFYPWDTDRGFSVKNYYQVDPGYGSWDDIKDLSNSYRLMFDFVANHASLDNPLVQSSLIERHLAPEDPRYINYAPYKDYVIAYKQDEKPGDEQLKSLARPRPNPVLSHYFVTEKENSLKAYLGDPNSEKFEGNIIGDGWVWTTFSRPLNPDGTDATRQVDLNFKNPRVFLETLKILYFYIEMGASLIRLDAIGYIWKKLDSISLHEPEAHLILEVIHEILSNTHPEVVTISEVNEQQDKVFEYLGPEGQTESDLVYQFSHFPLAIYGVLTGNGLPYRNWLKTTDKFKGRQFITVLGSHDGLGLKPARGLLTDAQIQNLTDILVNEHKGLSNYAVLPGGQKIVYEICATPWNLINKPGSSEEFEVQLKKYLIVLTLGLTVRGIPGIYFNGLMGAENYDPEGGLDENRTVNRENFDMELLLTEIEDPENRKHFILDKVKELLEIRSKESVFDPFAPSPDIIDTENQSFVVQLLTNMEDTEKLLSVTNLSPKPQILNIGKDLGIKNWTDLLTGNEYTEITGLEVEPYTVLWLKNT